MILHGKSMAMSILLIALFQLFQSSHATYGTYFSYTTTNHLAPPQYAVYKSPAFSNGYQYSYLPQVIPPVYSTQTVWPAVSNYNTYKAPVSVYEPAFTAPCTHGHLSSFSHVIRPIIGPPVKTKPNNSTEHVFKPIYYPYAWGHQPLFSYQGTIQHIPMPPKDEPAQTEKPETKPEATTAANDEAKGEEMGEENDEEDEKEVAAPASEPAKPAEESTTEKAEAPKAKRDAVSIAKNFGLRKKNKKGA